ncbi:MAG TPA: type II secretion system F family protein [Syntrophomonadaceae bacterium]|nr:type II secretion system F family protein [Syntrophomonadaceae bacterium]
MRFAYNVRTRQGKYLAGFLEAENRETVIQSLLAQNYSVLSLKEASPSSKEINLEFSFLKVKTKDLVVMTRQLATMISAGLSILKCFSILEKQTADKKLKKALGQIRQDIAEGMPMWKAVDKHRDIFSNVYINMIKAGELGGMLDEVLDKLAVYLEREHEISSKIKSASVYPAIISVFAVIMIIGLITFVLPSFVDMFKSSGMDLPTPTRILLAVSAFLRAFWMYLTGGIILMVVGLKRMGKTPSGRYFFDNMYLHLPLLGKTISRINVARFARTMGTLVKAGIPILQALEVLQEVAGNAVIARAIGKARASISEGESIAGPLEETGVFEPMVTQMISVGEETGSLDDMLVRMSEYYEREVMYMVDALMAAIEPILIVIVALLVGGIVSAILLPVFDLSTTLQ